MSDDDEPKEGERNELAEARIRRGCEVGADQPGLRGYKLRDDLGEVLDRLQARDGRQGLLSPVPNAYRDLDQLLGGGMLEGLVVVTAPASLGEESIPQRLIHRVGIGWQRPVLVLITDYGDVDIAERLLSIESGVEAWRIEAGAFDDRHWRAIGEAITRMKDAPVCFRDLPWDDPLDLQLQLREFAQTAGLGMIVFDSFDRLEGNRSCRCRQGLIKPVWLSVKAVARELCVPIVHMSPLQADRDNGESPTSDAEDFRARLRRNWRGDVAMTLLPDSRASVTHKDGRQQADSPIPND